MAKVPYKEKESLNIIYAKPFEGNLYITQVSYKSFSKIIISNSNMRKLQIGPRYPVKIYSESSVVLTFLS